MLEQAKEVIERAAWIWVSGAMVIAMFAGLVVVTVLGVHLLSYLLATASHKVLISVVLSLLVPYIVGILIEDL